MIIHGSTGWKHWYVRLCTEIGAKRSDAVIVPYNVTKEELVSRFNISESKIHVVSYGVDSSHAIRLVLSSIIRTSKI